MSGAPPSSRAAWWAALLLVTALAAVLRLTALDRVPPGFFIDEAQDALDAHTISTGSQFPAFIEGPNMVKGRGREPLFHYAMAAVFKVFGVSLYSVRLTPALLGIATVSAFFILCEQLWGLRFAVLAASLLAVCRWHLTFSRIAMRAITVPLWITLTGLAFVFLLRRRTITAAVVFGVTLGLGFYTYQAYWAVPLPLAVLLIMSWRRASVPVRGAAPLIVVTAVAFLLTLAPLALYVLHKPAYFAARLGEVWDPTTQGREGFSLRDNLQRVLFMLHLRGDPQPRHNIPGKPQLDPITGIAFAIGVFVLLKRRREDPLRSATLLLFYVSPLLPSVFSDASPHAMRALGAVLAACAIAAVGVEAVAAWMAKRRRLAALRLPLAFSALVVLAATGLNSSALFIDWAESPAVAADFSADIPRFFDYAAELTADGDVYACPYVHFSPSLRFLRIARGVEWRPFADESAFTAAPGARDRIFICDAPRVNFLIERLYPQASVIGRYSVYGTSSGKIYRVSGSALHVSLNADERDDVAYLLERVNTDFAEQVRQW